MDFVDESEEAKIKLFKVMDRIDELKKIPAVFATEDEELELKHLEVQKINLYDKWKAI